MEDPSKLRRKIVVIATSPNRKHILLRRDENSLWNVPNSHLHWPLGRRKGQPIYVASHLLKDFTLSVYGDIKSIKKNLTVFSHRSKLPTGGFMFHISEGPNITIICDIANRVRKHLKLKELYQMHTVDDILQNNSYKKYGNTTIEAVRTLTNK
jgi:hypothetical protein